MKKILILAVLFLFIAETFAQVRPARRRHYDRFERSTTYVVEDRDPFSSFNQHMKKAMEKHWTVTPFKFISFSEFERMRTNEDASFMIFADISQRNLEQVFEFINFVMGDKKRDFESMPDLASVPLAYRDANDINYIYKMGIFVKFMQTYVKEQATTPRMRLANVMNVNDNRLKNMELWLLEHELAPNINTPEKLAQHYPYKVRIVTRDEIAEAIAADRKDVAILHKIGPEDTTRTGRGRCFKFIIAAEDGRILYSSYHDVDRHNPDALLLTDLQSIVRNR